MSPNESLYFKKYITVAYGITVVAIRLGTYSELDCDWFMTKEFKSSDVCCSFGEEGTDESVSSSISEWEDGGLLDFFLPKACLKELLSYKAESK